MLEDHFPCQRSKGWVFTLAHAKPNCHKTFMFIGLFFFPGGGGFGSDDFHVGPTCHMLQLFLLLSSRKLKLMFVIPRQTNSGQISSRPVPAGWDFCQRVVIVRAFFFRKYSQKWGGEIIALSLLSTLITLRVHVEPTSKVFSYSFLVALHENLA